MITDQTRDLLTMLMAGTGASLNPATAPISNMVTGQIQSRNYANLLQQMLAGGGKLSMDAENVNIKAPVSALGQGGFGGLGIGNPGSYIPGGTKTNMTNISVPASAAGVSQPVSQTGTQDQNLNINQLFQSLLGGTSATNPSSSPLDISSANLAGLTPEHISSALQMKMMQDEAGQKGIMNRLEIMKALQGFMPEQPFPIEVPGLGYVPADVWKALPDEQKEYAAYRHQELAHGGTPLSFQEFITSFEPHERIQFLQQLAERPELKNIEKELRASGATTIKLSPYEQTFQRERAQQQTSVMSPDLIPKLRKEVSESIDARSITDMKKREDFINQKVKDLLEEQVLSAYPDAYEGIYPTNSSIKGWWTKTDDGRWMLIQRTPGE